MLKTMRRKGNPLALLVGMLIQSLWRTIWRFLKKLGLKLPYEILFLLLCIYPEKTIIETDTCISVFIATLFTIART